MRKLTLLLLVMMIMSSAMAQRPKYVTASLINAQTAKPFGSFSRLMTGDFHPGFEIGGGMNWSTKKKHDWFQEIRLSYFYHRFVHHSLSFYTEAGYRYKLSEGFALEARIGGGFSRVIVANQVFTDGYEKDRYTKIVAGRSQAIITTSFGLSKVIIKEKNLKAFFQYQQRIQTPFVQSYIPLLPYNIAMLGVNIPLHPSTSKK